jgi:hypothetical protein
LHELRIAPSKTEVGHGAQVKYMNKTILNKAMHLRIYPTNVVARPEIIIKYDLPKEPITAFPFNFAIASKNLLK